MAHLSGMMLVFSLCVCVLTMSMAAEDSNIQPLRDESGGSDLSPDKGHSTPVDNLASRLLHGFTSLSEVLSNPDGPIRLVWRYCGEFSLVFARHDTATGVENVDKHEDEPRTDETKDKTENNGTKIDCMSASPESWYARCSIQLVLAVLTLCAGRSICSYAVTYIHAHQARYLSHAYDIHHGRCRRTGTTTHDLLLFSNRIGRFVCYDSQHTVWGDIARRLCPRTNVLGGSHGSGNGLNLITDIDRDDKEHERVVEDIGQIQVDLSTRDHERGQVNQKEDTNVTLRNNCNKTNCAEMCETTDEETSQLVDERKEISFENIHHSNQRQKNQTISNSDSTYRHDIQHIRSAADASNICRTNKLFVFRVNKNDTPSMSGSSQLCNPDALRARVDRV